MHIGVVLASFRNALNASSLLGQCPNLLDNVGLFVHELFVIGSVFQERRQKFEQAISVLSQNLRDGRGFVWIGDEDLRHNFCQQTSITDSQDESTLKT